MSVLETTVARLEREFERPLASDIERVTVRPGGAVVVTVRAEHGLRCFEGTRDAVSELHLKEDRLPARKEVERVLSWRPGRRVTWIATSTQELVHKGYRKSRFVEALSRLERVQGLARTHGGLRPPRIWSRAGSIAAYAMERVEGSTPAIGTGDVDVWAQVGMGVRALQVNVDRSGLPVHDAAAELDVLHTLAARVGAVVDCLPAGWAEVLRRLSALEVSASEPVTAHRDLHDGQLVLGERGLTLLDFDLLCAADPALDLANLTAHMQLRALQDQHSATPHSTTQDGADACARVLLEAYLPVDSERFHDTLRFYQGATFLRLALIYRLRPRWTGLVDTLVSLAARCAEERVRG